MAWIHIPRRVRPYSNQNWEKRPQISVRKRHISFNRLALEAFGLKAGRLLDVFVDPERGLLGFKSADCASPLAYRLSHNRCKAKITSLVINCSHAAQHFPAAVGQTFDLVLQPGESTIVAQLAKPATP